MQIGPLSEWVSAVAEFVSIAVALFLPYLNAHRESVKRAKKFEITIKKFAKEAMNGDEKALQHLKGFVNIGFLASGSDREMNAIITGQEIAVILENHPLTDAQIQEINHLLSSFD